MALGNSASLPEYEGDPAKAEGLPIAQGSGVKGWQTSHGLFQIHKPDLSHFKGDWEPVISEDEAPPPLLPWDHKDRLVEPFDVLLCGAIEHGQHWLRTSGLPKNFVPLVTDSWKLLQYRADHPDRIAWFYSGSMALARYAQQRGFRVRLHPEGVRMREAEAISQMGEKFRKSAQAIGDAFVALSKKVNDAVGSWKVIVDNNMKPDSIIMGSPSLHGQDWVVANNLNVEDQILKASSAGFGDYATIKASIEKGLQEFTLGGKTYVFPAGKDISFEQVSPELDLDPHMITFPKAQEPPQVLIGGEAIGKVVNVKMVYDEAQQTVSWDEPDADPLADIQEAKKNLKEHGSMWPKKKLTGVEAEITLTAPVSGELIKLLMGPHKSINAIVQGNAGLKPMVSEHPAFKPLKPKVFHDKHGKPVKFD